MTKSQYVADANDAGRARAGVARGTFYNYFETTEDVLIAVAIAKNNT